MQEDMRRHPRFPVENRVFVELVAPEFGSSRPGTIVNCKTLEVSSAGLRLITEQQLPAGAILQLAIELAAGAGTLYLVGEVRWSGPVPATGNEPGWSAGLALLDAEESDIKDWVTLTTLMENWDSELPASVN